MDPTGADMNAVFLILFLITIVLCISTYAIYPVAIWVTGRLYPFTIRKRTILPKISIVISAYNEEKSIEEKIRNTLELDYPADKTEILIGSDGSGDQTVEISSRFCDERVRVFDFHENRGKTSVQNDLAGRAGGEIFIFTDAASFLPPDAIKKLIRNFADDRVGCVAGRMRFVGTNKNLTAESQGLYWRYEVKIRELESAIGSLIGVDGPLYAVRRQCYIPLERNMISDLMTPLLVLEKGKKVVLEPEAIVDEAPTTRTGQEFNTRRRITLRGLIGIFSHRRLLNPFRYPSLALQIFFHKVVRWFVGPMVIINFFTCFALSERLFFRLFLVLYVLFFMAAGFGYLSEKIGRKTIILKIPYYFSLVNFAATMGIFDFLRKKQAVSWKPVRN